MVKSSKNKNLNKFMVQVLIYWVGGGFKEKIVQHFSQ